MVLVNLTEEISQNVQALRESFKVLLERFDYLKKENQMLRKENLELSGLLEKNKSKISDMEAQMEIIKIAKGVVGSKEHKEKAAQVLGELIGKVDACIRDLNR